MFRRRRQLAACVCTLRLVPLALGSMSKSMNSTRSSTGTLCNADVDGGKGAQSKLLPALLAGSTVGTTSTTQ
uniref:Putative secreted protein n=1 Tax=Anopheles darlingi TaxID=43151 RepID=A0A2M4DHV6_ANODA